jgi:TetR/AcrR family transcriptional repressor of nem operon
MQTSITQQQLFERGLVIVNEKGLRGLSIRGLCQQTGINTGSFVYHFGNRERFVGELLERWYAPLLQQVQMEFDADSPPEVRLQAMLRQLLTYLSVNGKMLAQLLLDAAAGEAAAISFLKAMSLRHPPMLMQCIVEAQQAKTLVTADPAHQMLFLMSSLGMPIIAQHVMGGKDVLPDIIRNALAIYAIDTNHIEQRLQWALKGLSPREHHQ